MTDYSVGSNVGRLASEVRDMNRAIREVAIGLKAIAKAIERHGNASQ